MYDQASFLTGWINFLTVTMGRPPMLRPPCEDARCRRTRRGVLARRLQVRAQVLLSRPVPCFLDPRCSLSSNVFIEGGNGRVGGHAAHVRHSRGSGNPGGVLRTRSRRLMDGAPALTPDADGQRRPLEQEVHPKLPAMALAAAKPPPRRTLSIGREWG